jgi:hypothetical protein
MVAPRVGHLHLLDASTDALAVARQTPANATNVNFHLESVGEDNSLAFAFSLGVVHHVFVTYLLFALDNRPVSPDLAFQQYIPNNHCGVAADGAARHQSDHRDYRLLAPGPFRSAG